MEEEDVEIEVEGVKGSFNKKEKQLSIVGQSLPVIPAPLLVNVIETHGQECPVQRIDLSWNDISSGLSHLAPFSNSLNCLVLDNNELGSTPSVSRPLRLPELPRLDTLSLNHNKLSELDALLEELKACTPSLVHLSLLFNPICPSELTGGNREEYEKYRVSVLTQLPGLKHLDATSVSAKERAHVESLRRIPVARPDPNATAAVVAAVVAADHSEEPVRGLDELPSADEPRIRAQLGVSAYEYHGRHSEGNRFILDSDL